MDEVDDSEEFYVCLVCGKEDHPDSFGQFCPECGTNLDELDEEAEQAKRLKS